jgi:hypothetical protein
MNFPQIHLFIDSSSLLASDEKLAELNPHGKITSPSLQLDAPISPAKLSWNLGARDELAKRFSNGSTASTSPTKKAA